MTASDPDSGGVPLAQILEPYEAQLLAGSGFDAYRLVCARLTGEQRSDVPGWEREEIGRDEIVGRGTVLVCGGRTEPGADVGGPDLIVLDDQGSTTSWWVGSDGAGHPPATPDGLLCREYMATESFLREMELIGGSPPWNDEVIAYQWALTYWFLEGAPDRMDVDDNGIPCELLFDPDIVAEVWDTAVPSTPTRTTGVALQQVLSRLETQRLADGHHLAYTVGPCWTRAVDDTPPYEVFAPSAAVDTSQLVGLGNAFVCNIWSDPMGEPGQFLIVVLDDQGRAALEQGSDGGPYLPFVAPSGLNCQEFLDHRNDDVGYVGDSDYSIEAAGTIYRQILAYWFVEGQPARMDANGNGKPCESLFAPEVVADAWIGDF